MKKGTEARGRKNIDLEGCTVIVNKKIKIERRVTTPWTENKTNRKDTGTRTYLQEKRNGQYE